MIMKTKKTTQIKQFTSIGLEDMERKYGQHRQKSMYQDHGILPEDILIDILLRLAARHLACLRFVCKSWCSLIDDVDFIERHYRLHYSICKADGDNSFLCAGSQTIPDIFAEADGDTSCNLKVSLLSKRTGDVPLDLTPNLLVDSAPSFRNTPDISAEAEVIGTVKGVVCIYWWKYQDLALWNPATREFKALTPWLSCRIEYRDPKVIAFGFDPISNDFKTLRGNDYEDGTHYYEIHSLKTNSWKRLKESAPVGWIDYYSMEAYLNGVAYWLLYPPYSPSADFYKRIPKILSFNFHTEVFEVSNLPDDATVREDYGYSSCPYSYENRLTVYKERLAFFSERTEIDMVDWHFDVWTVTQVDGNNSGSRVSSWQHLFTSRIFDPSADLQVIAFRMDGNMVVSLRDFSSQQLNYGHRVYNPTTDTFESRFYNPTPDTFVMTRRGCIYFEYVESLFPLSEKRVRTQEVLEN